jgi:colicin import membrane protein/protein TonB
VSTVVTPLAGRRDPIGPVIGVSLVAHALLLGFAIFFRPAPIIDLGQKPIVAKLVKLGEKREDKLLPRMEATPPPAPAAAVVPIPGAKPVPAAKTPPKPEAKPAAKADPLAAALNKVRRDQIFHPATNEGDPGGDPGGDADHAEAGDHYLALVSKALHDVYHLPATISQKERLHLAATVVLFIEPDGKVSRFSFEKKSGNGAFDDALEGAVHHARIPPPPADLRARLRDSGLGVYFRP